MQLAHGIRITLSWAARLLLITLVLELCARTDDAISWHAPFWAAYSEENLFVTDSLGYHLRPESRFQKWQINQFGFRGPEIRMEKATGVIRIITVGASETFGLYESPGMEYPAQLQAMLDKQQPGRYEVLNAGIPGISPSRIGHYFETWLRRFNPDIVIYYATPSFILEPEKAIPAGSSVPKKEPKFQFRFRIADKSRELFKRLLPGWLQNFLRKQIIAQAIRDHPPDWILWHVPTERVALFRNDVANLSRLVRAARSEIILATHGNGIDRGDTEAEKTLLIAWRKLSPNLTDGCILETEVTSNQVMIQVAAEGSYPIVDINHLIPKSSDCFADVEHFTDQGAALVAQAFTEEILKLTSDPGSKLATRQKLVLPQLISPK